MHDHKLMDALNTAIADDPRRPSEFSTVLHFELQNIELRRAKRRIDLADAKLAIAEQQLVARKTKLVSTREQLIAAVAAMEQVRRQANVGVHAVGGIREIRAADKLRSDGLRAVRSAVDDGERERLKQEHARKLEAVQDLLQRARVRPEAKREQLRSARDMVRRLRAIVNELERLVPVDEKCIADLTETRAYAVQRYEDAKRIRNASAGYLDEIEIERARSQPSQARETEPLGIQYQRSRQASRDMQLVGLALSGGGIRSATTGLGFLQGLASLRLLNRFDYLSTVSGGGYIGAWLAAWFKREGDVENVQRQLHPSRVEQAESDRLLAKAAVVDEEPEPVYHLRAFSNYLSPKMGLSSRDSWSLVSIYARNLLLNLAFLIPAAMALLLLSQLVLWSFFQLSAVSCSWTVLGLLGFAVVAAFGWFAYDALRAEPITGKAQLLDRPSRLWSVEANVIVLLCLTAVIGSWIFTAAIGSKQTRWEKLLAESGLNDWVAELEPENWWLVSTGLHPAWKRAGVWVSITALGHGLLRLAIVIVGLLSRRLRSNRHHQDSHRWPDTPEGRAGIGSFWLSALISGSVCGLLFYLLAVAYAPFMHLPEAPLAVATLGPPAVLLIFFAAVGAEIGFLGSKLREDDREWWASVCGEVLQIACTSALGGPHL